MKKASLFSGIGGIDLAAHWAGMETVVFCEREPFPQRVLRKHWPHVPIIDDVREVTREELEKRGVLGNGRTIDIISAGYPCQPFSYAGKRRGAEDDRHLWPEVKRILEEIRPRWFVGENVAGHVTLGLDDVLADLGGRVTPRKRLYFRLLPSAPATDEIEFSLWRTPAAANADQGPKSKGFYGHCLRTGQSTVTLVDEVRHNPGKMWPTPTANDAQNSSLPPSAKDWDSVPGAIMREGYTAQEGQLNPEWVEILMNFPPKWTEVD